MEKKNSVLSTIIIVILLLGLVVGGVYIYRLKTNNLNKENKPNTLVEETELDASSALELGNELYKVAYNLIDASCLHMPHQCQIKR